MGADMISRQVSAARCNAPDSEQSSQVSALILVAICGSASVQKKACEEANTKSHSYGGVGKLPEHFVGGAGRGSGVIPHAKAALFQPFQTTENLMFFAWIGQFIGSLDFEH